MKFNKEIMKKIGAVSLATCMSLSMAACGGDLPDIDIDSVEKVDKTKTQLYVGVFDGALGYKWLSEYKKMYEELHPDVQIIIDPKKDYDVTLNTGMKTARQSLYFLSQNMYSTFINQDLVEDITDVVREKCYDEDMNYVGVGGTKSIEDSMWADSKDVYEINDKYYALPNWLSPSGIYYDADLFEEYEYDVPETYNELIDLMNLMLLDDITPFAFSGMMYIYTYALAGVWASYEGKADFELNSTFNGIDSDPRIGEITLETAYKLQQQQGKKAALKFAYDLMSNAAYTTAKTRSMGLTNETAQQEFVKSINQTDAGMNRVAMFMESAYWEPETADYMDQMGQINPNWAWGKRNFKYMPFPKFVGVEGIEDQTNEKTTVYSSCPYSFVCINKAKTEEEKDLAKDFLKFTQSRECLAIYTKYTSCVRPYDYEMTPEEYNECTTLGKQFYDMTRDENVEFTFFGARSDYHRDQSVTWDFEWNWMSQNDVVNTNISFFAFYANPALTVDKYFNGLSTFWNKDYWYQKIKKYL